MIDPRWKPFTEFEYEKKKESTPDGVVRAIMPFLFCKGLFDAKIETLVCLCDVIKDSHGYWNVRMNRNVCWTKDMGRYDEHQWICYPDFPELYSIDSLKIEYQLALAMGYTIDAETIEKHDQYYTLKPEDVEEKKKFVEEIFS